MAVLFGSKELTPKVLKPFMKHFPPPHGKQIQGLLKPFPVANCILPREVKVIGLGQNLPMLSFLKTQSNILFLLRDVMNFIANPKLGPHNQFLKILSFIDLNFPNELVQNRTFQRLFSRSARCFLRIRPSIRGFGCSRTSSQSSSRLRQSSSRTSMR
jgi:hypothetical protein